MGRVSSLCGHGISDVEAKNGGVQPLLMFGRDPVFSSLTHALQAKELDQAVTTAQLQVLLDARVQAFKRVMPLAMRDLVIAQQRDKKRYRLVRGGGWDKPKATFKARDYVLLKQHTTSTLDALARPHILSVVEIRPTRVAMLEGRDMAWIEEQINNIAHNPEWEESHSGPQYLPKTIISGAIRAL